MSKKKKMFSCVGAVYATGGRKTSRAKVWLKEGNGNILVRVGSKYLSVHEAFPVPFRQEEVLRPLTVTAATPSVDVLCVPVGGGSSGQSGAISHGISRALGKMFPEHLPILRENHLLTRDPRKVQPKQPGKYKGRRTPQSSKR